MNEKIVLPLSRLHDRTTMSLLKDASATKKLKTRNQKIKQKTNDINSQI